ncbi:MAG: sigma-70 family RNA polymerase sigma factor [Acidobacteriota bacterium]
MKHSKDTTEDRLLVVRCQLGEIAAFDELVERWHPRLAGYVRGLVAEPGVAEELIQEVWLRILRGLPGLRDAARLAPWMHRIARNVVMDRLRAVYAAPQASDQDLDQIEGQAPLSSVDVDRGALRRGLSSLPLIEREVLTLFYLQELRMSEVAEILSIPVGTVKSRLFRARGLLRKALEAQPEGVGR